MSAALQDLPFDSPHATAVLSHNASFAGGNDRPKCVVQTSYRERLLLAEAVVGGGHWK
jgi:hypothetical protein